MRMTGRERREQLIEVGRSLFADKGYEAVSVEEIAARAGVSKPVVYEHFGGKEGLYAVVVDREMNMLLAMISGALTGTNPRALLEQAGMALFDYIDSRPDGFRILVRDSPVSQQTGSFASLIVDVAAQVEHLLADQFQANDLPARLAPMYSRMLVGMTALTGQWWVEVRKPRKEEVVAHVVNLAWNGLAHLDPKPHPVDRSGRKS
jgi:AcrR family transcriptional regulator